MMLTTKDVANRLNVSTRTVQVWVSSGDLPAFQMGKVIRIDEMALDEFILLGCRTSKKTARSGGSRTPTRRANALGDLLGPPSTRTRKRKSKSSDQHHTPSSAAPEALK